MATLTQVVTDAQKDKDLFMDLLTDVDATLTKRSISLSDDDKNALKDTFRKIRQSSAKELAETKVYSLGDRTAADGVIGW